jgi:predicted nucleic-acid-binding protein
LKAVDTNILARYIIADEPRQAEIASAVIEAGIYVPLTVLLETAWLLQSRYAMDANQIGHTLVALIDLPSVTVDDPPRIRWALGRFVEGGDFADMLHLVASHRATVFVTFDRKVERQAGRDTPVVIDTLRD